MKLAICLLATALLCGCNTTQHPSAPNNQVIGGMLNCGEYPTNYEALVHNYIKGFFKDPDSVKDLTISVPRPEFLNAHTDLGDAYMALHHYPSGTQIYCYMISFRANAKNGYGGYTGSQFHFLYVRDGEIVDCL